MKKTSNQSIQEASKQLEKQLGSPSVVAILGIATIGAFVYMSFLLRPEYRGDILPYTMVIIAELFIISQGLTAFWTILSGRFNPRGFKYYDAQNSLFGKGSKTIIKKMVDLPAEFGRTQDLYLHGKHAHVDVFIPVYGEAIDIITETAIAARDMYGTHQTYILDDGKSDEVEFMAAEVGVGYIRRPTNEHAKAGNINYALSKTKGSLFVIIDADFVVHQEFLYETVPFFEHDKLAFVQTPQYYDNQTNFISTGAGFMQHIFYSLVQAGKNRFNAAFCVGTNVIFRRSAIADIGGFYDKSKSEDIWTSLLLHEAGYRSVYINKVLALGKTPETFKAYSKQQLRWATGSFEIFLTHNPLFAKKLTLDQRIQYFNTTSFYFNGFAVAVLLLLPVFQIFFNITPIALDIPFYQWFLLYSGFYVAQLVLSIYAMGGFKIQTIVLSAASFPIYVKAFFNAVSGRDQAWQATNRVDSYDSPFNYVRMQVYIFIFLALTTITGIWKAIYTREFSISLVWCGINAMIFGYFCYIALLEARHMAAAHKNTKSKETIPVRTNAEATT